MLNKTNSRFIVLFLFFFPLSAFASSIELKDFWVRAQPSIAVTSVIYGTIINNTDKDVYLESVTCDATAKMTEIHQSIKVDGLAKMIKQEKILIPVKESFIFKPLSYHIMLMGLKHNLTTTNTVDCRFVFDNKTRHLTIKVVRPSY